MVARDVNRLNETSGLLTGEGHLTYSANLGNYAEIESLIDDVVEKCGKISGFVHCAGICFNLCSVVIKRGDKTPLLFMWGYSRFKIFPHLSARCSKNSLALLTFAFLNIFRSIVVNFTSVF